MVRKSGMGEADISSIPDSLDRLCTGFSAGMVIGEEESYHGEVEVGEAGMTSR